jgi:hypothetical protein
MRSLAAGLIERDFFHDKILGLLFDDAVNGAEIQCQKGQCVFLFCCHIIAFLQAPGVSAGIIRVTQATAKLLSIPSYVPGFYTISFLYRGKVTYDSVGDRQGLSRQTQAAAVPFQ